MFGTYVVLLFVSGLVLIVLAIVAQELRVVARIFYSAVGVGFLAYGSYLAFFLESGRYRIMWPVFVLPVVLLIKVARTVELPADSASAPLRPRRQQPEGPPVAEGRRTAESRERRAARTQAERAAIRAKYVDSSD
ncbi:hypothetical protein ACQPW1_36795 [Nocardia sp. CA-128927]|uniref:hypothetical protein n=1 Tax=Nocardia sp. CA-128927 TaxID=3239975 RepID=UPI003D99A083